MHPCDREGLAQIDLHVADGGARGDVGVGVRLPQRRVRGAVDQAGGIAVLEPGAARHHCRRQSHCTAQARMSVGFEGSGALGPAILNAWAAGGNLPKGKQGSPND